MGPDYEIVEVGLTFRSPGAQNQPWHRTSRATGNLRAHQLTSLAFNLTAVDTTAEMGPLHIATGTQFETAGFRARHVPPESQCPRFEQPAGSEVPQLGDILSAVSIDYPPGHD